MAPVAAIIKVHSDVPFFKAGGRQPACFFEGGTAYMHEFMAPAANTTVRSFSYGVMLRRRSKSHEQSLHLPELVTYVKGRQMSFFLL